MSTLGILMIATNSYLERWKDAVMSLDRLGTGAFTALNVHLFTDNPEKARGWAVDNLKNISVCTHQISNYGWPEATLYRYRFFTHVEQHYREDYLMYMDSDLLVISNFSEIVIKQSNKQKIVLVDHPGFIRHGPYKGPFSLNWLRRAPSIERRVTKQLENLRARGWWKGSTVFLGGAWENSKHSKAFVPWHRRKRYFYGAIWFGQRESFLRMISELNMNVNSDLENDIIAVWHDESHLNWYGSFRKYAVAPKGFCITDEVETPNCQENYVVAVTKKPGEGRAPTDERFKSSD